MRCSQLFDCRLLDSTLTSAQQNEQHLWSLTREDDEVRGVQWPPQERAAWALEALLSEATCRSSWPDGGLVTERLRDPPGELKSKEVRWKDPSGGWGPFFQTRARACDMGNAQKGRDCSRENGVGGCHRHPGERQREQERATRDM